jgi:hypothetical protein
MPWIYAQKGRATTREVHRGLDLALEAVEATPSLLRARGGDGETEGRQQPPDHDVDQPGRFPPATPATRLPNGVQRSPRNRATHRPPAETDPPGVAKDKTPLYHVPFYKLETSCHSKPKSVQHNQNPRVCTSVASGPTASPHPPPVAELSSDICIYKQQRTAAHSSGPSPFGKARPLALRGPAPSSPLPLPRHHHRDRVLGASG